MIYQLSDTEVWFPKPELADDDGLLAIGGDLSAERLLLAYHHGIFPWYSDESPILWHSPHQRFVLFPENIKVSSSMKKVISGGRFSVTRNQAFADVIRACSAIPRKEGQGTWITGEMQDAYIRLHLLGHAHSVEVWKEGELAGGLYGVEVNSVFCGESMFSRESNASKIALISLCRNGGYRMIDCQVYTAHLESLGAQMISRAEYLAILHEQ